MTEDPSLQLSRVRVGDGRWSVFPRSWRQEKITCSKLEAASFLQDLKSDLEKHFGCRVSGCARHADVETRGQVRTEFARGACWGAADRQSHPSSPAMQNAMTFCRCSSLTLETGRNMYQDTLAPKCCDSGCPFTTQLLWVVETVKWHWLCWVHRHIPTVRTMQVSVLASHRPHIVQVFNLPLLFGTSNPSQPHDTPLSAY